jgi:hypothetical protein
LHFKYILILLISCLFFKAYGQTTAAKKSNSDITIQWQDSLPGDFSFCKKWSFTDGIEKNDKNKFQCVYNCHPRIELMYNTLNQIETDSLKAFFSLIDTTHYYHTLQCNAWSYEFDKANFITCIKNEAGYINCFTLTNSINHSSLRFSIINDKCLPTVQLNSADKKIGFKIFKLQSGSIIIDKSSFNKGILKAEFDFTFNNSIDAKKPINWKGLILSPIDEL